MLGYSKNAGFDPEVKRLAVKTEDHPLDYITFEGIIPRGNYGAGTVIIWDLGRYYLNENEEIAETGYLKEKIGQIGHIRLFLKGKKLKGFFNLIRTSKDGDKEQWMFVKAKDQFTHLPDPDDEAVKDKSFDPTKQTGETNLSHLNGAEKKELKADKLKPMLATLVEKPFDNTDWIFELKLDGYRVIASKNGEEVNLYSRYGNTFNEKYKVVAEELKKIKGDFILDGEVVILDDEGKTNFQALQNITSADLKRMYYYVFDLIWLNGFDLKRIPLIERKKLLKSLLLKQSEKIRYTDHIETWEMHSFRKLPGTTWKE
ncbi:MAG: hypothetical protein HC906_03430 [Bacteroidales bacterium]|nr:hypothetical protein [Bacteroidales bacterium]